MKRARLMAKGRIPRVKPFRASKARITRTKGIRKPKEKSISKLIKEADKIASEIVRGLTSKTDRTFGTCYTCGKCKLKRRLQCGHFISRKWKAIRWHFDNMRPQCAGCNKFANGQPQIFRRNLIKEIGKERVEYLEEIFDQDTKMSHTFLESKIQELKSLSTPQS